jgi:hypothetical protein
MAACPDKLQFIAFYAVDQQPVRLYVAFPVPFPIANKQVIPVFLVKRLLDN